MTSNLLSDCLAVCIAIVTLVSDDDQIHAHKVILTVAGTFFYVFFFCLDIKQKQFHSGTNRFLIYWLSLKSFALLQDVLNGRGHKM